MLCGLRTASNAASSVNASTAVTATGSPRRRSTAVAGAATCGGVATGVYSSTSIGRSTGRGVS